MTIIVDRNADGSRINCQSNAERQKAYRDRKRGGPPIGRWGHLPSMGKIARMQGISRTMCCMGKWLTQYASPDVIAAIKAGKLKVTPTYRRLKDERDHEVFEALYQIMSHQ